MMGVLARKEKLTSRVAIWTHFLEPGREAISNEVWALRRLAPCSFIFGLSRHYWFRFSLKQRYVGLHYRFFFLFRLVAFFAQRFFSLNHIYSDLGAWHFLKILRKKPLLLSLVTESALLPAKIYEIVDFFVAQSKSQRKTIASIIQNDKKVAIVLPGIDLERFHPAPPPASSVPFTIVFASVPIHAEEYEGRGLNLLMEVARHCPEFRFLIAWRTWGDPPEKWQGVGPMPQNMEIRQGILGNMESFYSEGHAAIAPFLRGGGKPFPHSILEALACGRPVVVSKEVAVSEIILREGAGEVFAPELNEVIKAVHRLRTRYVDAAACSRPCAEKYFSLDQFLKNYAEIYEKLGVPVRKWKI